jgi:hypothetical protein
MTTSTPYSLTWTERDGSLRSLDVDAVLREGNTRTAEVTENPVERGADVADHIRPKTDTLTLEFIISNTPVRAPQTNADGVSGTTQKTNAGTVLVFSGEFDRVESVFQTLKRVEDAGLKWQIFSGLTVYTDFVLEQVQAERDQKSGSSVKFVCTFRFIRLVATRQVSIPVQRRRVRPTQPRGVQQPEPPRNSVLSAFFR